MLGRAGYPRNSHAAKALQNIVDTFPRELLFQIPAGELFDTSMGILHLQERQRIRLFVHPDRFGRFYSCIVFVPRDRYTTASRLMIQGILEEAFGGTDTEFTVRLSESVLARLWFVIHADAKRPASYDIEDLERRLQAVSRTWADDLRDALLDSFGEEHGTRLFGRYGEAFRADYRESYSARVAVLDVEKMERIGEGGIEMSLYRPLEAEEGGCASSSSRPIATRWCSPTRSRCWRTWASRSRTSIRATSGARVPRRCGSTTSGMLHAEGPTSTRTASTRSSATRSPASGRGRSRTTASTGWCCAPGSDGARS